jgi:hypothetical protein
MNLEPLRLPDLDRLASAGEVRRLSRGPRTVEEVLRAASDAMDREDAEAERARDPVAYVRAQRRRRRLWDRLFH